MAAPAMKIVSDNNPSSQTGTSTQSSAPTTHTTPAPSRKVEDHKPAAVERTTRVDTRPTERSSSSAGNNSHRNTEHSASSSARATSDNANRPAPARPTGGANLKQVETSSPTVRTETSSDSKKNVSSMQPSQLKSTVRSLASDKAPDSVPAKDKPKLQKIETKDHDTDHS